MRFSLIALCLAHTGVLAQSTVTLSDGEFDPGSWEIGDRVGPFADDVNASASQQLSGGNPGLYRQTAHSVITSTPQEFAYGWIWHRHTDDVMTLDAGSVTSVRYSADYRRLNSSNDQGTTAYAAVFQSGNVYLANIGLLISTGWVTLGTDELGADGFSLLLADGSGQDPEEHPDFSVGGPDLTFGYAFSNTPFGQSFSIVHAIDNWEFEIDLEAAPTCPGDIADDFGTLGTDGMVSFGDFLALLGLVGPCPGGMPGCTGDIADDFGSLNGGDGMVSFGDFLALLGLVGACG